MQNVEKELPGLIKELLQAPAHQQRALIEKHYTPDCRLTHALVIGENREEIVRIFQYWRFANHRLDVDVNEIVLSRGGRRAYCLLTQHVQPAGWWPQRGFSWESVQVLDLEESGSGSSGGLGGGPAGWLIAGHEDLTRPSSLLRPLPLLGWAYEHLARRAAALSIYAGVGLAQFLRRGAFSAWSATWVALGATDAGPPPGRPSKGARKGQARVQAHRQAPYHANPKLAAAPGSLQASLPVSSKAS